MDRVSIVHDTFLTRVAARDLPQVTPLGLDAPTSRALFEHQCLTRALDIVSREMQKAGQGFIRSARPGMKAWRRWPMR